MTYQASDMGKSPFSGSERKALREDVGIPSFVHLREVKTDCLIKNLSVDGALLLFNADQETNNNGDSVRLNLPEFGVCYATIQWLDTRKAGVQFRVSREERAIIKALYLSVK